MLHQREKQILQYLMEQKDSFMTSKDIATHLSCSDRTVRTYLKSLMDLKSAETGWEIEAKQGFGYRFFIQQKELYQQFLKKELLLDAPSSRIKDIEDRHNYILNKLLFEQAELYFDDLAEELFVSRSTLSLDFKKIRKDLAPYDLQIESKAKRGVYVIGSERNKRRFIMDYFFRNHFFHALHNYIDIDVPGRKIQLEEVTMIVFDECREGFLRLSDFVIQNLVIHIALSFKRIVEGFHMSPIEDLQQKDCQHERKIAQKILHRVYLATGISFPKEEIDYITLHLLSKATSPISQYGQANLSQKIREQLIEALSQLDSIRDYGFQEDFQLIEGLVTHLSTVFIRLKNHVSLENPLLKDIKEQYFLVFEMTKEVLAALPLFAEENLSEDEVAYVALHFMAAIERLKEQRKFNILVICATGYGSAQMLRARIEEGLGHLVHIVDVIGYYELNDERLRGIDFIISSIDLSNLVFSVPVFTVTIFLKDDELNAIKQKMKELQPQKERLELIQKPTDHRLESLFDEYFSEECFQILETNDKDSLLKEMLIQLGDKESPSFVEEMQELITQREKMSSILFSETIAVPHPIKPLADRHRIGVAILPNGLAWNEETPKIQLVFLPSPSIYENEGLAQLTSKIVDLLERSDLQEQMIACQNFTEFKRIFLQI